MVERDPFDLFLDRCAREVDSNEKIGVGKAREISEEICPQCLDRVPPGCRHCPNCGALQAIPENVSGTFRPRTLIKRHLAVTLLAIEGGYEIGTRAFTRAHLKIRNLCPRRVHVSLTYVDSVLIDITGRQYSPLDPDELTEDSREPIFPTWFYIYPDAYKDGVLLFRESSVPLQKAVICAMHQENEDELFVFDLNGPPRVKEE